MRDYAEIGWRVQHGRRRARTSSGRGALDLTWSVLASPATTASLMLVVAGLLLLEARGAGAVLPVADPGRLVPLALRVVVALLGLNLIVVFLDRALPGLLGRRARPVELAPELAVEHRAPLPDTDRDVAIDGVLAAQGLRTPVRRGSPRRAVAVRGRLSLVGAALSALGMIAILIGVIGGLDDAASGRLTLIEGEPVETFEYAEATSDPLTAYTGLQFTLRDTAALLARIEAPDRSAPSAGLEVVHPDQRTERVDLRPGSAIGLGDGTWLRLASVREIGQPTEATIRLVGPGQTPDGIDPMVVRTGDRLTIGESTMVVSNMRARFSGTAGSAIELTPSGQPPFWTFSAAARLASGWPHMNGHHIEILEMRPGHVVEIERFAPQDPTWPMAGLALLVLGGALLLVSSHLAVEVHDELDRVVVRVGSVNNASGAARAATTLAGAVEEALEAPDDTRWALDAPDELDDDEAGTDVQTPREDA